ncbi:MAG: hypothetical protein IPH44_14130 [Myxococcales bacterium]|nr:hypothetical protein [Myxococcales bacterium]
MLNSPDMAYRFGTILTASLGIAACSDPPDRGDRPATAGDLDPTFDGDGVVTTGRAGRDVGRAVLAQSVAGGERLVVAGKAPRGNATAFFMARFDHDGALDRSFGGAAGMGYVETSLGATTSDEGKSLAIMPDGDLVLAGISTDSGNGRFAAARYDANGMPDAGFGQQGATAIDFGSGNDEGKALAVHPCAAPLAPCLVIVGKAETPDGTGDIALVQLDAAGATAATFGKVATDLGGNDDEANDVVALADGALIVVGFTGAAGHHDLIVLRYTPAGQLDTGFGVPDAGGRRPGYTVTSVGDDDRAFAVAVDPTGGVVVAGRTATAGARRRGDRRPLRRARRPRPGLRRSRRRRAGDRAAQLRRHRHGDRGRRRRPRGGGRAEHRRRRRRLGVHRHPAHRHRRRRSELRSQPLGRRRLERRRRRRRLRHGAAGRRRHRPDGRAPRRR